MKHLLCAFLIFFTSLSFSQQLEVVDFTRVDAKLSFDIEASKVLGVVDYYFNILKPTDSVFLDAVHMDFK
ncbi:MAG: M1 family peptidase, partial [Winogradskyella sp.]|nr:M1 family peptidase [Winogradskyella sp.]